MMRHGGHLLASLGAALAVAACQAEPPPRAPAAPDRTEGPVVYGDDGRHDWHELEDSTLQALTRGAAAAMVPADELAIDDEGQVTLRHVPLGAVHDLCADQRYWSQPTVGSCSGTLIDDDLVLTAGHCVESAYDCGRILWVFDYLYEAPGELAPIDADAVYRCVDIVAHGQDDTAASYDFAVIQLDRPAAGRTPAEVAAPGPVERGDPLIMQSFPNGIPLKVDSDGIVADARATTQDEFISSVDAFHGSSGSGIFDRDLRVVGVLSDGAADYEDLGSCQIVSVLDPDDADESAVYAYRAIERLCAQGYPSATLCGDGEATCGDGFCTGDETTATCAEDCDGIFAAPEAWRCNPAYFAVGDDCDCDCGAYDPDCDDPSLDVLGCAPGGTCQEGGACTVAIPEGWTCRDRWYAAGDDCDCDCGAYDPDCDDGALATVGCAPGGACQPDGTCTRGIPDDWRCRDRIYDGGDGCDCDCGAYDPDCDQPQAPVSGCAPGSGCLPDGQCDSPIPAGWICPDAYYGVDDDCDCNCGAYDPDCDDPDLRLLNCFDGQICDPMGACAEPDPTPPAEPDPEPGHDATSGSDADTATSSPLDGGDATTPPDGVAPTPDTRHTDDLPDDVASGDAIGPPVDAGGGTGGADDGGCAVGGGPGGAALIFGALACAALARRRHRHHG